MARRLNVVWSGWLFYLSLDQFEISCYHQEQLHTLLAQSSGLLEEFLIIVLFIIIIIKLMIYLDTWTLLVFIIYSHVRPSVIKQFVGISRNKITQINFLNYENINSPFLVIGDDEAIYILFRRTAPLNIFVFDSTDSIQFSSKYYFN